MLTPRRYVLCVLATIVGLHYILSFSHEDYGRITSMSNIKDQLQQQFGQDRALKSSITEPSQTLSSPIVDYQNYTSLVTDNSTTTRANATFVFLCRNKDLNGVISSVQQMEDRFNRKHGYPWVFLNDEPFTDEFIKRVSVLTDAQVSFGLIPPSHWFQPDWIDEDLASEKRRQMASQGIIYADSVPYRNMCRYNSGFFYHHELLKPYRYYWRVEPDVKFFCDLHYDPFKFMEENKKVYSFTISLLEWEPTITTLWQAVNEFVTANPQYVAKDNALSFLSNDGGKSYNLCHFWSNFEIADMEFWRSEAYEEFFMHLESKGGFYYERWGDAPVHSIAAALFARKDQIHFFSDIGYKHEWFQHCPSGAEWEKGKCACDPNDTFDYVKDSCLNRFQRLF